MRSPKLFGPVAVSVLAVLVALVPLAPAAAQRDRISPPSQTFEPPAPEPPPPPPPAREPLPPPPPLPPDSGSPPQPPNLPTDPGTVGRRIVPSPPPASRHPTDPGEAGRHIVGTPIPDDPGESLFPDDAALLDDMEAFAEAPPPAALETLAEVVAQTSDTSLVEVQVFVSDPKGRPVTGLKQDDFLLFVDGEAVPVASFYAQTAAAAPGADRNLLERLIGLQTFYSLGFVPERPRDGGERRIAVVVKGRPGLTVRARERRADEGE